MIRYSSPATTHNIRGDFIGGSDARIIMGEDEKALIRLWQEKRGAVGPEDLSGGRGGRVLPVHMCRRGPNTVRSASSWNSEIGLLLRHRFPR
jgi:hypothetical protein